MKSSIYLLITGVLLALSATSQTPDYSQWVKTITIDGKSITILRVDELKFPSTILGHISGAQDLLDDLKHIYKKTMGQSYNPNFGIEHSCQEIEKVDKTFPVHYYREELKAYRDVHDAIKQKEQDEMNARIAQQNAEKEKLKIERLKTGYYWINHDSINVRSKPNMQALIIGQIHRLSYVKAFQVDNKPDWAEISFGEYDGKYTGYVLGKYVAEDWDELTPTAEDSVTLISGPNYNFIPNKANLAKAKQAEAAQQQRAISTSRSGSGRKYHLGPRGGCYFINSHGNKEYVDRSYCN
ncbi:MAG TPA: SH3 domain-containing protein [Niastella sp.]